MTLIGKKILWLIVAMLLAASPSAGAQEGNRMTLNKLESLNERLNTLEKAVAVIQEELQTIKNLIQAEHQRTRKWISVR